MSRRLVLFDDDPRRAEAWQQSLSELPALADWSITAFDADEFRAAVDALEDRRRQARTDQSSTSESLFDKADVVVLDYDFLDLGPGYRSITGDHVAYLCRAFSNCGLIITLNEFGELDFDLTMRARLGSYADLLINDRHLVDPSLWGSRQSGFRPWAWPVIPMELDAQARRIDDVTSNPARSVLDFFGLSETAISKSALAFLGRADQDKVTFADFAVDSGSGLRHRDKPVDDTSVARIAAARLAQWIQREVLVGQDVLVDAPHLVARLPSLLRGDSHLAADWNRTCELPTALETPVVDQAVIGDWSYPLTHWTSRPTWYWTRINNDERIDEVQDPWNATEVTFAFCEDVSEFVPLDEARAFTADLASPFVRRFVADPKHESRRWRDLASIEYRPTDRLER